MKKMMYVLALLALISVLGGCNISNPETDQAGTDPTVTDDWQTYQNEKYGFEFNYPQGSSIETRDGTQHQYIRLQNYKSSDDNTGLAADEYYLEIFIFDNQLNHKPSKTCQESVVNPQLVDLGAVKGYRGLGAEGGDAGGKRFALCVDGDNVDYFINGTENNQVGPIVNAIFDSFKFTDIKESIAEVESYANSALCTDAPTSMDVGGYWYPIAPQYTDLKFLGQLFTAYNCGQARVDKIWGVEGNDYTLGSTIWLITNPDQGLIDALKLVGFKCGDVSTDADCKVWQLRDTVKIDDLMKLEPYHEDFKADDCINCG